MPAPACPLQLTLVALQLRQEQLQIIQRTFLWPGSSGPARFVLLRLAAWLRHLAGRRRQRQAGSKLGQAAGARQLSEIERGRALAPLLHGGLQDGQQRRRRRLTAAGWRPAHAQAAAAALPQRGWQRGAQQLLRLRLGAACRAVDGSTHKRGAQLGAEQDQQALCPAGAAAAAVVVCKLLELAEVARSQGVLHCVRQGCRGRFGAGAGLTAIRPGGRFEQGHEVHQLAAAAVGVHRLLKRRGQACRAGKRGAVGGEVSSGGVRKRPRWTGEQAPRSRWQQEQVATAAGRAEQAGGAAGRYPLPQLEGNRSCGDSRRVCAMRRSLGLSSRSGQAES